MKLKYDLGSTIKYISLIFICTILVCAGCSNSANKNIVSAMYDNGDALFNETCAMYDLLPSDFEIESIQYGSFIEAGEALVVLKVGANEKALEMRDNGDVLKAFAVCDENLLNLKGAVLSVVADEVSYTVIAFPESDVDFLFINAIDIAAGPEDFVGGLYNVKTWENVFPLSPYEYPESLPVIIGNKIYLSTISEMDIETRLVLKFDTASESIRVYDEEQAVYVDY